MKAGAIITVLLFLLILPSAAFALQLEGVQIIGGRCIIINAEPAGVSDEPSPIVSMFGASVPMNFTDIFYFEPGLRLYGTTVTVTGDGKAVPAAVETLNRVTVLNLELRPELGAIFHVAEKISLGVTGAPQFTFRIPVTAYDDAEELEYPSLVGQYYHSAGRFFGIYLGGFFSWDFGERSTLRVKAGTNLPVYHIWDGDDAGFHDQLSIEPEIGMIFRF